MSNPVHEQTIKSRLLALFNATLLVRNIDTQYLEADLVFAAPIAYEEGTIDLSEPESANSTVLVTAGEGLEQVVYNLHYTRLDLAVMADIRGLEIEGAGETTTHALLPGLSAHLGILLTIDDVEDLPIVAGTGDKEGVDLVTVRAKVGSLGVFGEVTLDVIDLVA